MNVDQIVLLWLPAVFMVLLAGALHLWPPSTINGLYGYRTRRSMSSPEAWNHAQSRSNSLIIEWTGYMVFWTVILSWTGRGEEAILTASGLMTLGVLLPLIFIEKELKQGPLIRQHAQLILLPLHAQFCCCPLSYSGIKSLVEQRFWERDDKEGH